MSLLDLLAVLVLAPPCVGLLFAPFVGLRFVRAIPLLGELELPDPAVWPALSIVVPARDEVAELAAATASRLATGYPDLQLVLVDDRSSDGTAELVDELAAGDERVVSVHVADLPDGWLGKVNALKVGSDHATGDWLLFTDADVHLHGDVLHRALAYCEAEGVDHLAVLPDLWSHSFLLDCAISAFGRMFALTQRPWHARDPARREAVGVGAFNLVRKSAYLRTEGFAWLAFDVVDDVALALLMKRSGARCDVVSGRGLVGLSWYESLGAMIVGLEKNTFAASGCSLPRLLLMAAMLLWIDLAPYAALLPFAPPWLRVLAAVGLLFGAATGVWLSRFMRRPVLPTLLTAVGSILLAVILVRAGVVGARRGGVMWRDTFYPSAELRRRMRVTLP